MEKGTSELTRFLLRTIGKDKQYEIDIFVSDAINKEYLEFNSEAQVSEIFGELAAEFSYNLTYEEALNLRTYTGFSYKEINAILRDNWNYEQHGLLTQEKKSEYGKTAEEVEKLLFKFPSLDKNIKTYRGVTLAQFREYGITSLDDLSSIEGKYFYDAGFTSTSLVRQNSLFDKEAFQIGKRNIEIEYLIPDSCHDGALLLDENTSHYKVETEYLINSSNLIKILSVDIDKENNKAFIRAILIPKRLWDPMAIKHLEEETQAVSKKGV